MLPTQSLGVLLSPLWKVLKSEFHAPAQLPNLSESANTPKAQWSPSASFIFLDIYLLLHCGLIIFHCFVSSPEFQRINILSSFLKNCDFSGNVLSQLPRPPYQKQKFFFYAFFIPLRHLNLSYPNFVPEKSLSFL